MKYDQSAAHTRLARTAALVYAVVLVASACGTDSTSPIPGPAGITPDPGPSTAPDDSRQWFIWSTSDGLKKMPKPPGVSVVAPNDINERGEVVGTMLTHPATGRSFWRAFMWSPTRGYVDLGAMLGAGVESVARGVDESGTVVGYYYVGTVKQAFVWTETTGSKPLNIQLPYLGDIVIESGRVAGNAMSAGMAAPYRFDIRSNRYEQLSFTSEVGGSVNGLNEIGEAAGYNGYMDHGFGGYSDAVHWDAAGLMTTAMSCGVEWNCFAYLHAINRNGLALGSVRRNYGETRVFRWSRSSGVTFVAIPNSSELNRAVAINDDGTMLISNERTAFVVHPSGAMTTIEPPSGSAILRPLAMSTNGTVVGMIF